MMDDELNIRNRKNALRFFAAMLILFLILSTRFFPKTDWAEYAFGALAVALFVLYLVTARVIARAENMRTVRTALVFAAAVNVIALSLFVVHAVKADAARAEVPESGRVRVLVSCDSQVYSSVEGFVEDMDVDLSIGDARVGDGSAAMVDLNAVTDIRCAVSFRLGGKTYAGEDSTKVRISSNRLKNQYRAWLEIPCEGDTTCEVTITATYEPSFWEILFYKAGGTTCLNGTRRI